MHLPPTDKTPEIILDTDKSLFQIKGNCLPENIREFSQDVTEKLDAYLVELKPELQEHPFRLVFRLGYFNSAAAKFIADVLIMADTYNRQGISTRIYWYFDEDDLDMLEAGEEIAKMVGVEMEFVAVTRKQ